MVLEILELWGPRARRRSRPSCSSARSSGIDGLQRLRRRRSRCSPMTARSRSSIAAAGLRVEARSSAALLVLGGARLARRYGSRPASEASAVNTAVCVILIGAGLLCLDRRPGRGRRAAMLVAALIAGLALLGYLFDVPELRRGLRSVAADADGGADRASPCSR